MSAIVTLAEAKLYLRMSDDTLDSEIQMLLDAAIETVADFTDTYKPEAGAQVPARVKLAVLAHVRQAFDTNEIGLSAGAQRLLGPFRNYEI